MAAPEQSNTCELSAGLRARAAAVKCALGALPVGQDVVVTGEAGKPVTISPGRLPASADEIKAALLDLIIEEETAQLAAAIDVKLKGDDALARSFSACLLFTAVVVIDKDENESTTDIQKYGAIAACKRLLLDGVPAPSAQAAAAGGCRVAIVPVFKKGGKITRKRVARAKAAISRRLAASCSLGRGRLDVKLVGKRKRPLAKLLARSPQAAAVRRLSATAVSARQPKLRVRWDAR